MAETQAGPLPRSATPIAPVGPSVAPAARTGGGEPPLQDVLVELWQNIEKLMRQEVALARTELEEKASALKARVIASAAGAGLLLASSLALTATIILVLSLVVAPWLAALITTIATGGVGYALLQKGKPSASDVTPERSLNSVKKDIQTFREAAK